MTRISIDIDPRDFLSASDVSRCIMEDAVDLIEMGCPEKAATLLASSIGKKIAPRITDLEEERRLHMINLFKEWYALDAGKRGDFWSWAHGKRHCS